MRSGAALCDFLGGAHLYAGIVTALYRRMRTGEGAVVDISLQDTVVPTLASALGAYFLGGEQGLRSGNRHPSQSLSPYNVYPARDGHVALICIRDGHCWFLRWTGRNSPSANWADTTTAAIR